MSTRLEIREQFRIENPELTDRVITDTQLNIWCKAANKEICAITRCIVSNVSATFNTEASTKYYDLSDIIYKFFDIDDIPGGGVYYDDVPLKKATPAEMNQLSRNWRSAANGTPKKYWRRGKYLWLHPTPDAAQDVDVDSILLPDDFDSDLEMPYNDLEHLSPYHDGIQKHLQARAKAKVGKQEEATIAKKDYSDYVSWMKRMVAGYSHAAIYQRPGSGQSG